MWLIILLLTRSLINFEFSQPNIFEVVAFSSFSLFFGGKKSAAFADPLNARTRNMNNIKVDMVDGFLIDSYVQTRMSLSLPSSVLRPLRVSGLTMHKESH